VVKLYKYGVKTLKELAKKLLQELKVLIETEES